jgi:2-methylisocitrate lyase-like PEP mutase family enzyme
MLARNRPVMTGQVERANEFRALHHGRHPLVLPNAWDVPSARVFEEAGFPAVATSSAGLMVSLGYPDGQRLPRSELVAVVQRIASRLSIPLSADVVAGYGRSPRDVARTVGMVLDAGAVGINFEDLSPSGNGLLALPSQLQKIRAIQEVGKAKGVPLVINARTDALRHFPGSEEDRRREALRRCISYRDAGADCVYPMGLTEGTAIAEFVEAVACPVNVMIRKGLPSVGRLEKLGVKRVSFGPSASYAAMGLLRRASEEVRSRGTYRALLDHAISFDELNDLAVPRTGRRPIR